MPRPRGAPPRGSGGAPIAWYHLLRAAYNRKRVDGREESTAFVGECRSRFRHASRRLALAGPRTSSASRHDEREPVGLRASLDKRPRRSISPSPTSSATRRPPQDSASSSVEKLADAVECCWPSGRSTDDIAHTIPPGPPRAAVALLEERENELSEQRQRPRYAPDKRSTLEPSTWRDATRAEMRHCEARAVLLHQGEPALLVLPSAIEEPEHDVSERLLPGRSSRHPAPPAAVGRARTRLAKLARPDALSGSCEYAKESRTGAAGSMATPHCTASKPPTTASVSMGRSDTSSTMFTTWKARQPVRATSPSSERATRHGSWYLRSVLSTHRHRHHLHNSGRPARNPPRSGSCASRNGSHVATADHHHRMDPRCECLQNLSRSYAVSGRQLPLFSHPAHACMRRERRSRSWRRGRAPRTRGGRAPPTRRFVAVPRALHRCANQCRGCRSQDVHVARAPVGPLRRGSRRRAAASGGARGCRRRCSRRRPSPYRCCAAGGRRRLSLQPQRRKACAREALELRRARRGCEGRRRRMCVVVYLATQRHADAAQLQHVAQPPSGQRAERQVGREEHVAWRARR